MDPEERTIHILLGCGHCAEDRYADAAWSQNHDDDHWFCLECGEPYGGEVTKDLRPQCYGCDEEAVYDGR